MKLFYWNIKHNNLKFVNFLITEDAIFYSFRMFGAFAHSFILVSTFLALKAEATSCYTCSAIKGTDSPCQPPFNVTALAASGEVSTASSCTYCEYDSDVPSDPS